MWAFKLTDGSMITIEGTEMDTHDADWLIVNNRTWILFIDEVFRIRRDQVIACRWIPEELHRDIRAGRVIVEF